MVISFKLSFYKLPENTLLKYSALPHRVLCVDNVLHVQRLDDIDEPFINNDPREEDAFQQLHQGFPFSNSLVVLLPSNR